MYICGFIVYVFGTYEVFGLIGTEIGVGKNNVNIRLTGHQFMEIKDKSLHDCVRECTPLARCKSFNYDKSNRVCELNDADSTDVSADKMQAADRYIYSDISAWPKSLLGSCADNTCTGTKRCSPTKDASYTCLSTDCDGKLPPGFTFADTGTITIGSVRTYKFDCPPGTIWEGIHNTTCRANQKWDQMENYCREIHNCSDVKQCSPTYTDDEYWLYSQSFGGKKVKMYCHGMGTSTPTEYLTVNPDENFSINGGTDSITEAFKTTSKYAKIRIDMKDMTVNKGDTTFAEIVGAGTLYVSYAQAETCNCNWGCKHGTFSISTEGTGFKFSSSLSVSGFGWQPYVGPLTKNNDNTKMSATCGGYCGGCEPSGSLYLYHDENTVVDESSAVLAKCD